MWERYKREWAAWFPELLPATCVVLASPLWATQLIGRGRVLAAVLLAAGVVLGAAGFVVACRRRVRWLGFAAMGCILLTAYCVYVITRS